MVGYSVAPKLRPWRYKVQMFGYTAFQCSSGLVAGSLCFYNNFPLCPVFFHVLMRFGDFA